MTAPTRIDEQLFDLVERLRRLGWNIGMQQHLDAQRLLLYGRLPGDSEALRLHLAPLLCRSGREQAQFERVFSPWAAEFLGTSQVAAGDLSTIPGGAPMASDPGPPSPVPSARQTSWYARLRPVLAWLQAQRRRLLLLLGALALLGLQWRYPVLRALLPVPVLLLLAYVAGPYLRDLWSAFLTRRGSRRREQPETFTAVGVDDQTLYRSIALSQSAQRLRRHRERPSTELDLRATLERTLRAGNLFAPVYRRIKRMPEYLALIDRAALGDHQAALAGALLRYLQDGELVAIDRYYFDRDPRYCYPETDQLQGDTLAELKERHAHHRLLLFCDGAGLFDPLNGEAQDWLDELHGWGQPILFTLAAPLHSRAREQILSAKGFVILRADERGLAALADLLENPLQDADSRDPDGPLPLPLPQLVQRLPRRWLSRTPPAADDQDALIDELGQNLGPDGFLWLAACAVYPELRWPLTLELGRRLRIADLAVTLARLAPLPWFRHGAIPDWLRERLLDALGSREVQVRAQVESLLRESRAGGAKFPYVAAPQATLSAAAAWRDYVFLDLWANACRCGRPSSSGGLSLGGGRRYGGLRSVSSPVWRGCGGTGRVMSGADWRPGVPRRYAGRAGSSRGLPRYPNPPRPRRWTSPCRRMLGRAHLAMPSGMVPAMAPR